jgi:hypothetical protein
MPPLPKKGEAESDPNNKAGEGSEGAADPKEVEGLKAALAAEREKRQGFERELAHVKGTVEGLKSGQKPTAEPEPRIYTRAELRVMVDGGKITEEQMDAQLEQQLERKLEKKFKKEIDTATAETRVATTVETQIGAYIEAHPDLTDVNSDLRAKVQAEFDYLLSLGDDPKDKRTELKAIRAAVGALAPKGRKKEPEASEETGGSDGGTGKGGGDGDAWSKDLTAAQKAHYQKKINQGIYKGPTDKNLLAEVAIVRKQREARGSIH